MIFKKNVKILQYDVLLFVAKRRASVGLETQTPKLQGMHTNHYAKGKP